MRLAIATARATTATEVHTIAAAAFRRYCPKAAALVLATRWGLVTGMRGTDRLLLRVIGSANAASREVALAQVGAVLMNPAERFVFGLLVRSPEHLRLHRFSGVNGQRTGWYVGAASEARAQWETNHASRVRWARHKAPCFVESAIVPPTVDRVLAVKIVGERVEIVLTPDRARSMTVFREVAP